MGPASNAGPWAGKSHRVGRSDCHTQFRECLYVFWFALGAAAANAQQSSDSPLLLLLAISVFAITTGLIVTRAATLLHTSDAW